MKKNEREALFLMKIAQFYHKNLVRLGIIENDNLIPLDFNGEMIDLILDGQIPKPSHTSIPLNILQFAPAVSSPSKIIGIGLNYLDHIQESKGKAPEVPVVFAKFPNSLIGHHEDVPKLITEEEYCFGSSCIDFISDYL
ncbi:MAG: hypothetical protein SV375_17465, partial [Thermodesulfobacteriota bacterium]|nr:hypothetical protein [Thermodesulfobacteriota bacterium]